MKTPVEEKFSQFYESWIFHLDGYSNQLFTLSKQSVSSEEEQRALVSKLTSHHKEYYTVKWASAHEDVLAFFSPVWLTNPEKVFSWVTGWKPSGMFRLLDTMKETGVLGGSLGRLTAEQGMKIKELRVKIRLEEEKVEREMERQQVAMADRKIVELFKLGRLPRDGECVGQVDGLAEVAVKSIMGGLEGVMKAADCVRLKTLKGILDVLSPQQSVDFLAGTCMLQIQLRQCGKRKVDTRKNQLLLE
ncbi:hypothetical protein SLA2020_405750 [Shorea laevis]